MYFKCSGRHLSANGRILAGNFGVKIHNCLHTDQLKISAEPFPGKKTHFERFRNWVVDFNTVWKNQFCFRVKAL